MKRIIALLIMGSLLTHAFASNKTKVFILAGQSNMVGLGESSVLQGKSGNYDFGHIDFYWADQSNQDILMDIGTLKENTTNGWFGPEIGIADKFESEFGTEEMIIIKISYGGTELERQWLGDEALNGNPEIQTWFKGELNKAITHINNRNIDYEIAGFFWLQGESDAANLNKANSYKENLVLFYETVIKPELSNYNVRYIAGEIPFVFGKTHDHIATSQTPSVWTHADTVREQQILAEACIPYSFLVDESENAPVRLNENDTAHFNTDGQLIIGRAFGEAMIELLELPATQNEIVHVSARGIAGNPNGVDMLTTGIIVQGQGATPVHIWGFSPDIPPSELSGYPVLSNPKLVVREYPSGNIVAQNDNYTSLPTADRVSLLNGGLPSDTLNAGLIMNFEAGKSYAVTLFGAGGQKGIGQIAVWNKQPQNDTFFTNISSRYEVSNNAYSGFMSFQVTGNSFYNGIATAWGSSIFGGAGLQDSTMELYAVPNASTPLVQNDNWENDWLDCACTTSAKLTNLGLISLQGNLDPAINHQYSSGFYIVKTSSKSASDSGIVFNALWAAD